MDDKKKGIYFIICAVLGLLIVILFSFISAAIYKKEQAVKNPYYFCDGEYLCCKTVNCDNGLTKSVEGEFKAPDNTYQPHLKYTPGSAYHQNCVLPVQNGILNYDSGNSSSFDFGYLYNANAAIPSTNPSPYYPGCGGPGSAYTGTKKECTDRKLNPWYSVDDGSGPCGYVSHDGPGNTGPNSVDSDTLIKTSSPSLATTLNPSYWYGSITGPYVANITQNGSNNYTCPYKVKNSNTNTSGNSPANLLYTPTS
jgi:hypothetical protein